MRLLFAALLSLLYFGASADGFQVDDDFHSKTETSDGYSKSLLPLVLRDTISLPYLLEELAILDYQSKKMNFAVKTAKQEWLELLTELQNRDPGELSEKYSNEATSKIFQKCDDAFRETLLPDQHRKLKGFLEQRSVGLSSRIDPAFLPALKLVEHGMPRGVRESPDLAKRAATYIEKQAKIKSECLNTIFTNLGSVDVEELKRTLPLLEQLAGSLGGGLSGTPTEVKKWSKHEFDVFEEEALASVTLKMLSTPELQKELELTNGHVQEMTQFYLDACAAIKPSDWVDPNYAKLILMTPDGKNEELKKTIKKKMDNRLNFEIDIAKKISDKFLVPVQESQLKKIAKFQRSALEAKYGDFFGALIGWSKTTDVDLPVDFKKRVDSARKKYYKRLGELRASTWKANLDLMTESEKDQFTARYGGSIYDYKQEAVEQWDSIRKDEPETPNPTSEDRR